MRGSNILVVGGAGYVGSHMAKALASAGAGVVVVDDLSNGHADAVTAELVTCDIADADALDTLLAARRFDAVMHFASSILVNESVVNPSLYYRNNVAATQVLLDAMVAHGIERLVFSSSAAIFGEPLRVPIDEACPIRPINPYGRTKAMVEQMLEDYDRAYGLRSVCLRYFNAAGADPAGDLGERHEPETHLIPLVLQAAAGRRESVSIFGTDYDTPDGTCLRDYVHVTDVCDAHRLALVRLMEGGASRHYNLGNGQGFSVREVIDTAQRVTGREIRVNHAPRRPGDPARLVANSSQARAELGWVPQRSDLETIVRDAWTWERKFPWH